MFRLTGYQNFHVSLYTTLEDVNIKALMDDADSEVGGKMLDF